MRLNASESAISRFGNQNVGGHGDRANDHVRGDHHRRQTRYPFRGTWVKVVHENARAHAHDYGHRGSVNAPTPRVSKFP